MARIIGHSDCTTMLKEGLKSHGINNIRDLKDVKQFHNKFNDILEIAKQQEKNILDNEINSLNDKTTLLSEKLGEKKGRLGRGIAKAKISHTVHKKKKIEKNYDSTIENNVNYLYQANKFLKNKLKFIYGAEGEEKVIYELSNLPDIYYVFNEVFLYFNRAIFWKKYAEWIKSSQIDHIVIGPTGIFLIETKNWTAKTLRNAEYTPHKQIDRAGTAFYVKLAQSYYKKYTTYKIVVMLQPVPLYRYEYVKQLTLRELNNYILSRQPRIAPSPEEIEQLANWLIRIA